MSAVRGNLHRMREPCFVVGDIVLTPTGRRAVVVFENFRGRVHLRYEDGGGTVELHAGHLRLMERGGD